MTDRLTIASAGKVSPREFMDAVGLSSPEEREARNLALHRQCMAAIESGETWGWPPLLVAKVREEMREPLTEGVEGDPFKAKRRAA